MNKAILIDPKKRKVSIVEYKDHNDIQKFVGGIFTTAMTLPNEETVFVNDEGLLNGTQEFFALKGGHQPYAGEGLLVGAELYDDEGDLVETTDPSDLLDWVKKNVNFMSKQMVMHIYGEG